MVNRYQWGGRQGRRSPAARQSFQKDLGCSQERLVAGHGEKDRVDTAKTMGTLRAVIAEAAVEPIITNSATE
jgi:hypothetical protein